MSRNIILANCICPIYSSKNDLLEKIHFCENKYIKKGIQPIFKITSDLDDELDKLLENNGYVKVKRFESIKKCSPSK